MRSLVIMMALLASVGAMAAQWKQTQVVNDHTLLLQFDDLAAVQWEKAGAGGADGSLTLAPLDLQVAANVATYQVNGKSPAKVGRKTRPHTFVRTGAYKVLNALEHDIYLVIAEPLKAGQSVTVAVGEERRDFTFDPASSVSPAIQTNQFGYIPQGPKIAYVSMWAGDLGALAFNDGASFHVLNAESRASVFSGTLKLRKKASDADSGQPEEGNYYRTDLYECDFSPLRTPGRYVLSVDSVGCSMPFAVAPDAYRQAYVTVLRGMYHQRCGTELKAPFTDWARPMCHDTDKEPLRVTDRRYMDGPCSDGPRRGDTFKETGELRRGVSGGWHDAGDWDREDGHADIPSVLLMAYAMAPASYANDDLNIPESGNGIPDIIDEARWGVDYYRRLQRPDGGVSVGMFESGTPKRGEVSSTDSLIKYCYAEEPVATLKQSAAAAHLSRVLAGLGRKDDARAYLESAVRGWEWAAANLRPGDEAKVRDDRLHAAASLYRASRDAKYQEAFRKDCLIAEENTTLYIWQKHDQRYGAWTFALAEDDLPGLDVALRERLRKASIHYAQVEAVATSEKRGNRRGYNWYYPMNWGRGSQPDNMILMVAHKLTGEKRFLDVMIANCDLTLGSNPLNMTWVTGLGQRSPHQVMQINYWYDPKGPNPGVTPMGPTRYSPSDPAAGVWLPAYQRKFVYPSADKWPPLELWFENRLCPPSNEFVVAGQASTAVAFGYLVR